MEDLVWLVWLVPLSLVDMFDNRLPGTALLIVHINSTPPSRSPAPTSSHILETQRTEPICWYIHAYQVPGTCYWAVFVRPQVFNYRVIVHKQLINSNSVLQYMHILVRTSNRELHVTRTINNTVPGTAVLVLSYVSYQYQASGIIYSYSIFCTKYNTAVVTSSFASDTGVYEPFSDVRLGIA